MRTFASIAATTIALLTLAPHTIAEPPPGTLQFKFEKRKVDELPWHNKRRQLRERQSDSTLNVQLFNGDLLYLVNATIGSDKQNIGLQIDTGSSDIWLPLASAPLCQQGGCPYGAFDASSSTSAKQLDNVPDFSISYVDGTQSSGIYFTDDVNLGGSVNVQNVTMALATQFDRGIGVMGIGFRNGEASAAYRQDAFTYPNVVNTMVDDGLIQSTSYSLWLDDLNANTGSILFGGVDTSKYTGSLFALPMQPDAGSTNSNPIVTTFTVAFTGLKVTGNGNNVDISPSAAQPAILDSGTSLTFLPDAIAQRLIDGFGAFATTGGAYALPCDVGNNDITLSFTFGGSDDARIDVKISEMVVPLPTRTGRIPTLNGVEICQFGIIPAGDNPILFGDTFLRSAYVVYDLDNLEIGLAQTNFNSNSGTGNVQPIPSGSGIPDVTLTASAVTVDNTFTGNPLFTAGATNVDNVSGTPTNSATFNLTSGGHANDKNIAGRPSVDGSLLASLVVVIGAFFFGAMLL